MEIWIFWKPILSGAFWHSIVIIGQSMGGIAYASVVVFITGWWLWWRKGSRALIRHIGKNLVYFGTVAISAWVPFFVYSIAYVTHEQFKQANPVSTKAGLIRKDFPRPEIIFPILERSSVSVTLKNTSEDFISAKGRMSMAIGGNKYPGQAIDAGLPRGSSRSFRLDISEKDFDSVADGKTKLELFISIKYEAPDNVPHEYSYYAIYDPKRAEFARSKIKEKWD